jgi:hypothetical protein
LSHRARVAIVALILLLPAVLAGCGGGDGGGGSEDPNQVLDQTFNNSAQINSGVLDLSLDGSAGGQGSLSAKLSGPFQGVSDTSQIPQLDWTGSLDAQGAGQSLTFEGGLTITSDNAYVTYKGQAYEVGARVFKQLQSRYAQANAQNQGQKGQSFTQACEQAVQQGGGDASVCDIDFTNWLTNVTNEGTESVGGTDAIHISGDANVKQIFSDISRVAEQLPGASAQGFSPSQLSQLEPAVKSATIDVYSGADDHLLRKLDFDLTLDLSALAGGSAIPVSTVDVTFSLAFSDVNSTQTVTAPENPKPISKLGVGGLGPLGSLGGSTGTSGGAAKVPGGGGGPSQAYLDCVQKAKGADELSKCASKL